MRWLVVLFCIHIVVPSFAQDTSQTSTGVSEESGLFMPMAWVPEWIYLRGSFLEPNRFAVVYDKAPERLRLEVGYGGNLFKTRTFAVGVEALIWSGLKALPGFRFPVETADYFFGVYSIFPFKIWLSHPLRVRARVSHISSHLVDGATDSVVGGSSSKFSREFISLEGLFEDPRKDFEASVGIKYVFHQIEKVEPTIQFPIAVDARIVEISSNYDLRASLSAAAGPSLPLFSAALMLRRSDSRGADIDLYLEYHTGYSRYGIDGSRRQNGFEVGVIISDFTDGYIPDLTDTTISY